MPWPPLTPGWAGIRFPFGLLGVLVVVLSLIACAEDANDADDAGGAAPAPRTTTPAAAERTPASTATAQPTLPPQLRIAHTDGSGVAVRDACDDESRVSAPGEGIREGALVLPITEGTGDCAAWMHVQAPDGRRSWVRSRYLEPAEQADAPAADAATATPAATATASTVSVGSLDLTVFGVERYDSTRHNIFNSANLRVEIAALNARGGADSEYNISSLFFELIDENGIAHSASWSCAGCPDQIVSIDLVRGGRVRGFVYFEVPADRRLTELVYEPLFSTNKARIALR